MPKRKTKSAKMGDRRDNSETDSQRRKRVGASGPYPKTKKRLLSTKEAPGILVKEGGEVLAIPVRIECELGQVIVQFGRGIHDRITDCDNVQILETMMRVSREQMITLSQNGMEKIQRELDQAERQRAEEKCGVLVESVWGCLRSHITEKVSEIRAMFNEDVQMRLYMVCVRCIRKMEGVK